jgi:hypothetical protein
MSVAASYFMISRAAPELDFGFFTISPAEYRGPAVVGTADAPVGVAEAVDPELSEHPAKKTPTRRSAITAGIVHDDLCIQYIFPLFFNTNRCNGRRLKKDKIGDGFILPFSQAF